MYVKLMYVKFVCDCCMCKEAGGGGEGARDTESKTRTPHKVVGKKQQQQENQIKITTFDPPRTFYFETISQLDPCLPRF